jgi:hypothetical protein
MRWAQLERHGLSADAKRYTITIWQEQGPKWHDMVPFSEMHKVYQPMRKYSSICGGRWAHANGYIPRIDPSKIYTIAMCHDMGPSGSIYMTHEPIRGYTPSICGGRWAHPERYIPPISPSENIYHFYVP